MMTNYTLADIEKQEQIPLSQRNLPAGTYEAVQRTAAKYPDKNALRFFVQGKNFQKSQDFTYRQLLQQITQMANMFAALQVGPQDVVSLLLPNLPQTLFAIFGAQAAGIANLVNPLLQPQAIADILNAAGTKVLVALAPVPGSDIWDKVTQIAGQIPSLETIVRVGPGSFLSGPQKYLAGVTSWGMEKRADRLDKRVVDLASFLPQFSGESLTSGRIVNPNDLATYFHTGGTTGLPKLAQLTHFNQVFNAWAMGNHILGFADEEKLSRWNVFCGLPLFHVGGFMNYGMTPFSFGSTVVIGTPAGFVGRHVIAKFWQIVEHYQLTAFAGVPTILSALLNVSINGANIGSLEAVGCSSASVPVELLRQFETHTGVQVAEAYGLTEAGNMCTTFLGLQGVKPGSAGLRIAYQDIKVLHLDDNGDYGRECASGETGLIAVRGPNVFLGYKSEQHNRGLWIDSKDGRSPWLNTGDLGYLDDEGYLWVTGRKKELIIRGGHNIDPRTIEDTLHQHDGVALAAAVGRPDAKLGEVPVVYVQLKPNAQVTEQALLTFLRENMGEQEAVPRSVHILDELPVTAVRKIYKPALICRQIEDVFKREIQRISNVTDVDVETAVHPQHSYLAQIHVTPAAGGDTTAIEQDIHQRLGRYVYKYELTVGNA